MTEKKVSKVEFASHMRLRITDTNLAREIWNRVALSMDDNGQGVHQGISAYRDRDAITLEIPLVILGCPPDPPIPIGKLPI